MLHSVIRSFALFLFFAPAVVVVPGFAITQEFDQSYPLQPGGSFELQNVNGTVTVEGWDRNEIEVHAVKTAKNRESDLERVSIEVEAKPDSVSVATHYPQDEGVEVAVQYVVHIPHGAHVEHIGTVNGTLRVAGVETVSDLHTVNGNIEVYESGGSVHAHTTNGNVRLELAHLAETQNAKVATTNGSIVLAVPSFTQANLETRSMNGSFFSELAIVMEGSSHPREVVGKLGKGGAPIQLHTVNGGIRVVVLRPTV
ncbi:MAG: DUF4097 family beta strand repeat-containing protein [Candidatus Acidiferrum sp.]